jgi:hypothetical protein
VLTVQPYVRGASVVVELGSGGGRVSRLIAPLAPLHCLDISDEMLTRCRAQLLSDGADMSRCVGVSRAASGHRDHDREGLLTAVPMSRAGSRWSCCARMCQAARRRNCRHGSLVPCRFSCALMCSCTWTFTRSGTTGGSSTRCCSRAAAPSYPQQTCCHQVGSEAGSVLVPSSFSTRVSVLARRRSSLCADGWQRFSSQSRFSVGGFFCKRPSNARCAAPAIHSRPHPAIAPALTQCTLSVFSVCGCSVVTPEIVRHMVSAAGLRVVREVYHGSPTRASAASGHPNVYFDRDYLVLVEKPLS